MDGKKPIGIKVMRLSLQCGIRVTMVPLSAHKEFLLRKKCPKDFDLVAFKAPLMRLYIATFAFNQTKIQALCYEHEFPRIIQALGNETPERAINYCDGLLANGRVVPVLAENGAVVDVFRRAVAEKMPLNAAALLTRSDEESTC